jgi:hypothetical protein
LEWSFSGLKRIATTFWWSLLLLTTIDRESMNEIDCVAATYSNSQFCVLEDSKSGRYLLILWIGCWNEFSYLIQFSTKIVSHVNRKTFLTGQILIPKIRKKISHHYDSVLFRWWLQNSNAIKLMSVVDEHYAHFAMLDIGWIKYGLGKVKYVSCESAIYTSLSATVEHSPMKSIFYRRLNGVVSHRSVLCCVVTKRFWCFLRPFDWSHRVIMCQNEHIQIIFLVVD